MIMKIHRQGIIFVISAPSGTGKTTICEKIIDTLPDLKMSVSHTTREPRTGEIDGVNYHFTDKATFEEMIKNNEFIEWAEVYGNLYGTSMKVINEILSSGYDVLLDIDTQGAKNIKTIYPDSVLIFIIPPSIEELRRRLINRKEEDNVIKKRLSKAIEEISNYEFYDYLVVNENLERAISETLCIISTERLKVSRIKENFITKLIKK